MLVRIEGALPKEMVADLRARLSGAPLEDGRLTAGIDARRVKNNRQLPRQSPLAEELGALVLKRLGSLPELAAMLFPLRMSKPVFSSYGPGMEYGLHVDNGVMPGGNGPLRSDIALTVFLSSPEEYDGGELMLEDAGFGHHHLKLPAGSAFAYPATTLHRVAPVTRGERLACVLWIQSQIRDSGHRRILVDLDGAAARMREKDPASTELKLVSAAYQNLRRLWTDL